MSKTTLATGKRFYQWGGDAYWSVTTIISNGVPKPALLPWGIKAVALGAVRERAIVDAMLDRCETPQECAEQLKTDNPKVCATCDEAIRYLKGIPYAQRDRAADTGTAIHSAIEALALGKPMPEWSPLIRGQMRGFELFLKEWKPVFELAEAPVFNRSQKYAGTLDTIAVLGGRRLVGDVKSGKGIYPEVGLQLAAYRHAEFIGLPDGSSKPMPETAGGFGLHLPPRGDTYTLYDVRCDEAIFAAFLYAREVFRWTDETQKSVLSAFDPQAALELTVEGTAA